MSTSDAVWIAEITDLKAKLDEYKSHKCFGYCGACRENLEQIKSYSTRLSEAEAERDRLNRDVPLSVSRVKELADALAGAEAALREVQDHARDLQELVWDNARWANERIENLKAEYQESESKREEAERALASVREALTIDIPNQYRVVRLRDAIGQALSIPIPQEQKKSEAK